MDSFNTFFFATTYVWSLTYFFKFPFSSISALTLDFIEILSSIPQFGISLPSLSFLVKNHLNCSSINIISEVTETTFSVVKVCIVTYQKPPTAVLHLTSFFKIPWKETLILGRGKLSQLILFISDTRDTHFTKLPKQV